MTNSISTPIQYFYVIIFICVTTILNGQYEFKNYTFTDEIIEVPEKYADENEVILSMNTKMELLTENGKLFQYYLYHEKTLINTDEAIERNNKVYIPFRVDEKLLVNKLRVILKNGKIIELKQTDIKEEINEEKEVKYHYYAVNGLDKGAVIEKLFILEVYPNVRGNTIYLQKDIPVVKTTFELIYPKHLKFKHKSYHGLPQAEEKPESYADKTSLMVSDENIDAIPEDEKYSNNKAHMKMLRYKLDSNLATGSKNINNYKEYASSVYENINVAVNKKETKDLESFFKKIPNSDVLDELIRNIEHHIKKTIVYNQFYAGNSGFTDAIKNKQANEIDLLRLFSAAFSHFNIENQIVITSKRYTLLFDKEFDSMEQLDDVLYYFPQVNKYLEPLTFNYRFPIFNFNFGDNYGLFIKSKDFGGVKMGVGEIGFIEGISGEVTHDFTEITIDMRKDSESPIVHTIHKQNGYAASGLQVLKDVVASDQYNEIMKEVSENFTQKGEIIQLKTEYGGCENIGKNPFILDVKFKGNDLVKKAGDNILLNVGELIGKQMELYQIEKRELPVELYYRHRYTRTIRILMPEGYEIRNPEIFNMKFNTILNEVQIASWDSEVNVDGQEVVVSNTENYDVIHYPLEVFESYKKVVNAAADFNKIVIVLAKK